MKPRTRAPYLAEFRKQMAALVQAGRTPYDLAQEFEPTERTIRTWIRQAVIDGERRDGPTTEEKQERTRFRKEVRQLRLERDVLAKAAA